MDLKKAMADGKKMVKTDDDYCYTCLYGSPINDVKSLCEYYVRTGKIRCCPIGYCDKYEKDPKKRSRKKKVKKG